MIMTDLQMNTGHDISLKAQIAFWLGLLAMLIFGMWLLGDVMTPFIAGMVLAYFLDPLADKLESWGMPRIVATSTILFLALVLCVIMLLMLVPLLVEQMGQLLDALPAAIATLVKLFNEHAPDWLKEALSRASLKNGANPADMAARAGQWIVAVARSIWSGSMALFNLISLLVITPIVLFYMLNDWDRMVATIDQWIPRRHAETIRAIARDIDKALAGFIRGQGTVCLALGIFYAVLLVMAGLKFGLTIGLISGFLSFIPYVGSTIGGILSIGMALVQFWPDWVQVLIIAGIFALGQFIEGNFLSPWLVGGSVGLHPVWIMFALVAFGYLFGFVGMLMAVPIAAAIKVVAHYALKQYMDSALYLDPACEAQTPADAAEADAAQDSDTTNDDTPAA